MFRKTAMLMMVMMLLSVSLSWADEPEVAVAESKTVTESATEFATVSVPESEASQEVVSEDSEPEQPD